MKKFAKILSSVLAASVVMSCCALNVFAASAQHTYTLSATNITDAEDGINAIEAGDVIAVELVLDDSKKLSSAQYNLIYDTSAFTIDTSMSMTTYYPSYIDGDWYNNIINTALPTGAWGNCFGVPTYGPDYDQPSAGKITFAWSSGKSILDALAPKNYTIGKFYLIAQDEYSGEAEFTLDNATTTDLGENTGTPVAYDKVTVKFKSTEPSITKYDIAGTENAIFITNGVTVTPNKEADIEVTISNEGLGEEPKPYTIYKNYWEQVEVYGDLATTFQIGVVAPSSVATPFTASVN